MKNGNLLIALIVGGVIGFVIGKTTTVPAASSTPTTVADNNEKPAAKPNARPPAPAEDKNVYKIPLGNSPIKGPADAKVTIVEYSDFQCPFCGRVEGTLKQIESKYGKDVRIAFKENPLPFHDKAQLAAEAAMAANEQGKFWEMHDKMFSNQTALTPADLDKYAQEIGLDMTKFKAALDSHKFKAEIDRDKAEAATFQANGTPHFFIDGRRIKGAVPIDQFTSVIDEELKKSDELIAKGTAKTANALYEAKTRNGKTKGEAPAPNQGQNKPSVSPVHEKDFAGAPEQGAKHPKVTIVEWSDFQCPFCSRAVPTVDQILKAYPNDVRFVFMHEPLPFHQNAKPAAIAATAAQNQGKFWEFYAKAFGNQKDLSPASYEKWAGELGLDVAKFKADIDDPKTKERVEASASMGQRFGANGTPTFFIDGRLMSGALPFEQFKTVIDDEIKKADELLKKGTSHADLYEKVLAENIAHAPAAPAGGGNQPDPNKKVNIAAGNSPVRGDPNAKVTIIEFSDFQCPYCGRAFGTVEQVLEKYKGKVKVVWKNEPLPFHPNAKPAAKAALAAGEQGKFWEMHDKLFQNQKDLSPENYEKWAGEIGLNVDQFKTAWASSKFDEVIDSDAKLGQSVGANGTPTFFINGHILVGAQPLEEFEKVIDQELKK